VIVPLAPGGGVDIVTRMFGQRLTKQIPGRPFVTKNRLGAGCMLGTDLV
jgi:tripartite-type tricarboxylate transporter receptor subunit TctC